MKLLKLGRICSMALVLSLSACASAPKPTPYLINLKTQTCAEYAVTKDSPITFGFIRWHPITDCDGYFAIPPKQAAEYLQAYRNYQQSRLTN